MERKKSAPAGPLPQDKPHAVALGVVEFIVARLSQPLDAGERPFDAFGMYSEREGRNRTHQSLQDLQFVPFHVDFAEGRHAVFFDQSVQGRHRNLLLRLGPVVNRLAGESLDFRTASIQPGMEETSVASLLKWTSCVPSRAASPTGISVTRGSSPNFRRRTPCICPLARRLPPAPEPQEQVGVGSVLCADIEAEVPFLHKPGEKGECSPFLSGQPETVDQGVHPFKSPIRRSIRPAPRWRLVGRSENDMKTS